MYTYIFNLIICRTGRTIGEWKGRRKMYRTIYLLINIRYKFGFIILYNCKYINHKYVHLNYSLLIPY